MKIERIDLPWVYTDDGKQIAFALIIGNREVGAELYEDKDGFYLSSWNDVEAIDADVTDTNVGKMTEEEAISIIQSEIRCNTGTIGDIDELCRLCNHTNECDEGTFNDILKSALNMAIEALQFQQKFVTCKDCKHWDLSESYGFARICEHWQDTMLEHGYCSYGERRDEE